MNLRLYSSIQVEQFKDILISLGIWANLRRNKYQEVEAFFHSTHYDKLSKSESPTPMLIVFSIQDGLEILKNERDI